MKRRIQLNTNILEGVFEVWAEKKPNEIGHLLELCNMGRWSPDLSPNFYPKHAQN